MRKVARSFGLKWIATPNLRHRDGMIGARLRLVSRNSIIFSLLLLLVGIFSFSTGDYTGVLVGLIAATSGFASFAAINSSKVHVASVIQAIALFLCGVAMTPFHPQGLLILPAITILSFTHWAAFSSRLFLHPQRPLEMLLAIVAGSMVVGILVYGPVNDWTVAGVVSGVMIFGALGQQWRALSWLTNHERNAPLARFNNMQDAIERTGSGIAQFSVDGGLVNASPLMANMLNCQPYALRGKGFVRRIHLLDQPLFLKQISDAVHGKDVRPIDVRLQRDTASGEMGQKFVWIEISAARASESEFATETNDAIVVFRDISDRRAQQKIIEEAREKAEQAAQTKSHFLATIGHELRTPLNAVVGFSEMMVNGIGGDLSPAHKEYSGHIRDSGRHLLEVVNMLLDMSKIEAGKFELDLNPIMPERVIAPVVNMVDVQVSAKNLTLDLDIQDNMPAVTADERAIRQIVINLLSNAVKFSDNGGVVSLCARRQGTKLMLSVRDEGVGMSLEDLSRLGEPFFQAGQGLGRRYEGTGLGLSIVKGLIELHGGTFHVDSKLGEGTNVTVLLPIAGPMGAEKPTATVTDIKSAKQEQVNSEQWPQQQNAQNHPQKRNVAS